MITKLSVISYKRKTSSHQLFWTVCLQGCTSEDDCPELVVPDDEVELLRDAEGARDVKGPEIDSSGTI